MQGLEELARAVLEDGADVEALKRSFSAKLAIGSMPTNHDIIASAPADIRDAVASKLRKKPSRTLSGVAPVAVMTSPADCPHGVCIYCPGGVSTGTPQSYTGFEPAAMRGSTHDYQPAEQVRARIEQLEAGGHSADKVDLIIMGGTFTSRDPGYQASFVKGCLDALNGSASNDLAEAQARNAGAPHRCIGLTVETRPDVFLGARVQEAVRLGATRVELGVQTIFDDVLEVIERGHTVKDTIASTRDAKEAGLKVLYHMMPGLPGSDLEMDRSSLKAIFERPEFMPDMLKIYPTLVVEGTALHELWLKGEYEPLQEDAVVQLLAEVKASVPKWVRIQRIQRDIPAPRISAGIMKGNIRQMARDRMEETGTKCQCIRCREAGRLDIDRDSLFNSTAVEYRASEGTEVFQSYENEDAIAGYLRLRLGSGDMALVRELKVLGEAVPIGSRDRGLQHQGMGARLLAEAEERAEGKGYRGVRVTSGVGVRDYYSSKGYSLEGMYMVKRY